MERLHNDPSTDVHSPYGKSVEHVYTLRDIDVVTRRVADDEWTGLGSAVAESMFETILEVGDEALARRGWVERTSLTERIAEEVSSAVEVSHERDFGVAFVDMMLSRTDQSS